ncbi:helix-turn-helix domain-containing protein [Ralstonia thomasii]
MLSDRLQTAMDLRGANQTQLAHACGVKPPSVHGWLNGKSKFLKGENLLAAAEFLRVNPWWLATGKGRMDASYHLDLTQNGAEGEATAQQLEQTSSAAYVPVFKADGDPIVAKAIERLSLLNAEQLDLILRLCDEVIAKGTASPSLEGVATKRTRKSGSTVQLSDVFNPHTPMGTDTQVGERDERKGRTHKRS